MGFPLRLWSVNWPSPARWALWSVARPRWIVFTLAAGVCTVGVTVTSLASEIDTRQDLVWFPILLAMGLTQAEMWREIERMRRRLGGQMHINLTSVWLLAGIVLLSPGWAALLAAALCTHLWARVWRHISTRPTHRGVASTMWVMLSCWAASVSLHAIGLGGLTDAPQGTVHGAVVVLTAAAVFELANLVLAATSIYLYTRQRSLTDLVGTRSDNALEVVTLCLGGLTAAALAYQPVLSLLTFPPLLLLHRQVLLQQLSITVATDEKTGLFTNATWHHLANGTHGHLVGDVVLKAATRALSNSVRHAVTQLVVPVEDNRTTVDGLSVSVGTACYPSAGATLDCLIHAADGALLHAKRTGRNRVAHAEGVH